MTRELFVAFVLLAGAVPAAHYGVGWQGAILPDPTVTPGDVALTDTKTICATKWGKDARHVTDAMKREVCRRYGLECPLRAKAAMPRALAQGMAGPAEASAVAPDPRVGRVEGVASGAVRAPGFVRDRANPAPDILAVGGGFEMGRVHAGGLTASMVQFQAVGHRAAQSLIDQHVRPNLPIASVAAANHPVADPQPASGVRFEHDAPLQLVQTHCRGDSSICAGGVEIDHLVSRELGGADTLANLWPQPWTQARTKDVLENFLHRAVCSGAMTLKDAQDAIRTDWTQAYRRMKGQ